MGLFRSPSKSHKSETVIKPTNSMTNNPTNFTDIQQANIVPVKVSQNHHLKENSLFLTDDTFAAPIIDPIMKHRRIGSSKMYCVRVISPTSN